MFCLAAVLPAFLIAAVAYWANRDLTARFALNADSLAAEASQALDDRVLTAKDDLANMAAKLPTLPLAQGQDADALQAAANAPEREKTTAFLRGMVALQTTFPVLVVTDERRLTYADSSPGGIAEFGHLQSFHIPVEQIAREGFAISHAQSHNSAEGEPPGFWIHVALAPPSTDDGAEEHRATHFLSGFFSSNLLLEQLRRQRIEGRLSDETGKFVLLDASDRKLGDSLPPVPAAPDENSLRAGPDGMEVPAENFVEKPAATAESARPIPATQVGAAAKTPYTGLAESPLTSYRVRSILDVDRTERSQESRGGLLLGLLTASVVIGAIVAMLLARRFLAPMYRLLDGARAWQGGDLNFLFRGRNAEGEWAELAESMNGLAARVHAQRFEPRDAQPKSPLPADASTAPDSPLVAETAHVKSLLRAATETETEGLLITDEAGRPLYSNSVFWETWEKLGLRPGLTNTSANGAKRRLPLLKLLRQTVKPRANIRRLRDLAVQPALKLSGQLDLKDRRRLQFSVRPFMHGEEIKGRIWRFRDISARSRLEEEVRTNKQLMDNLVENLPLALYVKDVQDEFRLILWNRAAEDLFGIPRIQAIGVPSDALQPEEVAAVLNENDLAALQNGGPLEIAEQHLANSPHGARLLRVIKVPIYDQRRMATHLFCLAEDITERNHAEQSVRREHALLRGLIDSLPDLISFKSHNGVYLGCNKAFEEFTGLQEKDFLGRSDEDLFAGLNLSLPPMIDRVILTDAQPRWRAAELHLPDGRVAHLNTVETPLRGPLGEVWGILAVSQVAAITEAATASVSE